MGRRTTIALAAASALASATAAWANPFVYTPRDLLLGFRQDGGVSEFMVNLGPSSNYLNLAAGSTLTITNFTPAQLQAAFGTFDGLIWSVSGGVSAGDGGDPSVPSTTLWLTSPRLDSSVQSTPWVRKSAFSQGLVANRITSMANGAVTLSDRVPADPIRNTATVVIEPAGDVLAYSSWITVQGNFNAFQGDIENSTADPFVTSVRSDFYDLRPGVGDKPGVYRGYFELRTDGTFIFQAATAPPPPAPPRPAIQSATRVATTSNTLTRISFTTTNDATVIYSLCFTNSAGLGTSVTNWPVSGMTVTGTGQVMTLEDGTDDSGRFYSIRAKR